VLRAGVLALAVASLVVQMLGAEVSFLTYGEYYGEFAIYRGAPLYQLGRAWPILGHALLFGSAHGDMAWIGVSEGQASIDWSSLAVLSGLLALTALGLALAWRCRGAVPGRLPGVYPLALVILAAAVSLALLARWRNDPRFGGGEDYLALLQSLAQASRADDLVLLGNHIYTDFFFNHNRSPARWYALDRGAATSERTLGLLAWSVQHYRRIWLVTDLGRNSGVERPLEAWLTQHAYKIDEAVFSPYARLLLYDTGTSPPAARQPLHARFGESIELTAFDLSFAGPAEPARLTLTWRALAPMGQDYTVFVQMLDANGQLIWQADRSPVDGFRPTSSWAAGEVIADRYGWQVPPGLPPGEYRLIAGLYDWQSGERLAVKDAHGAPLGDYVVLGTVAIQHPQE
jgi:hypothetical protein